MDASTSRTPLLNSDNQLPDDSRRRQAYLISYGGSDHNPYAPPLYAPTRLGSLTTVFLFSIFLLLLLSSVLTIEAVFDAEQISFASSVAPSVLNLEDNIVECETWRRSGYPSPSIPGTASLPWETIEFDVPIDERDLFVLARGSSSSGVVRVRESPDVKGLKVSVSVHHRNKAPSGARVCLVEREERGHGVAILTPSSWIPLRQKEKIIFVVDVVLPSPPKYDVSHLPGFTIDAPDFTLEIDDLSAFYFNAVTLKSTNSPITVQSVAGQSIVVEGKNGKISGLFNATQLLALSTTNNAIKTFAHAHNAHPGQPTVVSLKTANGALHANISLSSNTPSSLSNFRVSAHTTNAPLTLALSSPDARPVNLRLDATTSNAPVHVELPPAFEGRFLLRTTRFRPELHEAPRVSGRARRVSTSTMAGHAVFGNVSLVPPDGGGALKHGEGVTDVDMGWASVSTCEAPATLVL